MSKIAAQQLAHAIKAAAKAHEESYDKDAADAAEKAAGDDLSKCVDFSRFYGLSIQEACEKVCAPDLVLPVRIMLLTAWNDSLMWADNIK